VKPVPTWNGGSVVDMLRSCPPATGFGWARCRVCRYPMRSDGTACTNSLERHPAPTARLTYYATWTGTRENLAAMHAGGIRVLAGPDQLDRRGVPPLAWALDNGAWGAFKAGRAFDGDAFRLVLDRWAHGADWIVLPDIVAGGRASLDLSLAWLPEVRETRRLPLLAVQDGMTVDEIGPHVGPELGLFIGGSTAWKWQSLPAWGELARARCAHLHVGRANSAAAIAACIGAGAHSADGTSASVYSVNAAKLAGAARGPGQTTLPLRPREAA
jgi:hypothetical protein